MNVTLKPSTENYELLSTGVMDGTLFPAESVEAFKIEKVVRYGTFFPGGLYNTSFVFMMNQAKYDSLAPALKSAVDALAGEPLARQFGMTHFVNPKTISGDLVAHLIELPAAASAPVRRHELNHFVERRIGVFSPKSAKPVEYLVARLLAPIAVVSGHYSVSSATNGGMSCETWRNWIPASCIA
jgi:hypothetical protein